MRVIYGIRIHKSELMTSKECNEEPLVWLNIVLTAHQGLRLVSKRATVALPGKASEGNQAYHVL